MNTKTTQNTARIYFERGLRLYARAQKAKAQDPGKAQELYRRALKNFEGALELQPGWWQASANLGIARAHLGEYLEAEGDLNHAIHLCPGVPELHLAKGIILAQQAGQNDRAIQEFNLAIMFKPDYAEAYYHRALARWRQGDVQGAIADCEKAIDVSPVYAPAYKTLSRLYSEVGDAKKAEHNAIMWFGFGGADWEKHTKPF